MEDTESIKNYLKEIGLSNSVVVEGWWEQNKSFFSAMEMEKRALLI